MFRKTLIAAAAAATVTAAAMGGTASSAQAGFNLHLTVPAYGGHYGGYYAPRAHYRVKCRRRLSTRRRRRLSLPNCIMTRPYSVTSNSRGMCRW